MTKRETGCTVRSPKLWATAGLMLILVLSSGPALAAQINITNCTDTDVMICSYDNEADRDRNQKRKLDNLANGPDTAHFRCKANCKFSMATKKDSPSVWESTADNSCSNWGIFSYINHSYGSGDYLLVGTTKTDSGGDYKSANLEKGSTCPN